MVIRWAAFILVALLAHPWAHGANDAMAQKRVMHSEVTRWVKSRDFVRLSLQADREIRSEARFADGLWRLSLLHSFFEEEIGKASKSDASWKSALDNLRRNAERKPRDWLFYAGALSALAWQTRGSGFARDVSPEAMARFKELQNQARDVLDQHKERLSSIPLWYSRRITLALELGESPASQLALFEEGLARHPRYHGLYFARARALQPIWGGSKSAQLALLDRLATLKGAAAEEGIYARVLWVMERDLFGDPHMRSAALRAAMQVVVNEYPDPWNLQAMFLFACTGSHKEFASQLLSRLPHRYIDELELADERIFSSCKSWAEGKTPAFFLRRRASGGGFVDVLVE